MKLDITKVASKVTLFAAVLLAASVLTGNANAQSPFQGRFTLTHETSWGRAVLPAGDYRIRTAYLSNGGPTLWVIQDANSGRTVALESSSIVEDGDKGNSALFIGGRGNHQVIHSFRVAEFGKTFIFDRALADRRAVEEVNNTETVPVLEARK
jgi:hypothetical protein